MCGIAGFIDNVHPGAERLLRGMTDTLLHRGPDDEGLWCDREAGIAMGHRRLSILDLSPAGRQPMHSSSGRYVLVYNGEIYNHELIRRELEQCALRQWRGHSDTEVILEALESFGVEETLNRLIGMFAMAIWDRREGVLHLVRDRLGEKPLYYALAGQRLYFASELKALKAHPGVTTEIDRGALSLYLRYCYIPAPYTIFKGVRKLSPGCRLSFKVGGGNGEPVPVPYWSAAAAASEGALHPFEGSADEAVRALEELLMDAVGRQMVADVPLGAFLSGGIDSSTVVALMQAQSERPVRTFTIGFNDRQYNEAVHAREVARQLGTRHTELYIRPEDALEVIPGLPEIYDEPFGDSSQIATFLVSRMTRQHVTVSLSGDAGDEVFGGYNRYLWNPAIWNRIGWIPHALRRRGADSLTALSPAGWNRLFELAGPMLPKRLRHRIPGDRIHKLAGVAAVKDPAEMYRRQVSTWQEVAGVVLDATEPPNMLATEGQRIAAQEMVQQMMYLDTVTYLPDDILVKVDRAAMAVSLETRVPFLDHRVVEFAWRLPLSLKIREGQGKWILRQVLYRHLPKELMERPKMGFGVPIDAWLRGPLRGWAEALLDERRLKQEGYFNPRPIRALWHEHLAGKRNWQHQLWNVLMFQCWLERHESEAVAVPQQRQQAGRAR